MPTTPMPGVIEKWRGSAVVRIPARVLADAGIGVAQSVEVRAEPGRVVI